MCLPHAPLVEEREALLELGGELTRKLTREKACSRFRPRLEDELVRCGLNRIEGFCLHGELQDLSRIQLHATVVAKQGRHALLCPHSTVHREGEGSKSGPHASRRDSGNDSLVDGLAEAFDHVPEPGLPLTREA